MAGCARLAREAQNEASIKKSLRGLRASCKDGENVIDILPTLLTALLSAVVGGALAAWGAIKAVRENMRDLEVMEIRRQKVECLANLSGLRFVITEGPPKPDEYICRFMYEINRVPMLWSEDMTVLKDLRDFYADRSNERLIRLIRSMGGTTKLPMDNLSDADIRSIFLLPLAGK